MVHEVDRAKAVDRYFSDIVFNPPLEPQKPEGIKTTQAPSFWKPTPLIIAGLPFIFSLYLFSIGNIFTTILGFPILLFSLFMFLGAVGIYSKAKKDHEAFLQTTKDYEAAYLDWEQLYKSYGAAFQEEIRDVPSDAQMRKWVEEDKSRIKKEALSTLDIDDSSDIENKRIRPIIGNARKEARALNLPIKFKRGGDGVLRGSYYKAVILCLTDYHVASYECIVDMKTGKPINSTTKEFPYKEVTNLETKTTNLETKPYSVDSELGKIGFRVKKTFTIATSGSDSIEVDYSFTTENQDSSSTEPTGNEREAVETIRAIRSMLREYKSKFDG